MSPDKNQTNGNEGPQGAREALPPTTRRRPFGRLRSWLSRDPEPSVVQVMAEWAEYQLIFNDILVRLSAQLARQAKLEKSRLARMAEEAPQMMEPPVPVPTTKQALRTQYAMSRYGGRVQALLEAKETRDVSIGETGQG